jgi:geranylgeranyl transferase type-1 subunit beta
LGASMKLLGAHDFTNPVGNRKFNLTCQCKGGFSKVLGAYPDILHSYMGLAGLSIAGSSFIRCCHY